MILPIQRIVKISFAFGETENPSDFRLSGGRSAPRARPVRIASLYPAGGATPPLQEGLNRNPTSIAAPQTRGGMVLQGEFAKPFGIVKFSREATNFAAGKIASTFERASGAQRASPRSSLVSSSRAVAHSCRRDQPARIQRIPVRRCRRPACAVADASETMPPKKCIPRVSKDNPSACYAGTDRGLPARSR